MLGDNVKALMETIMNNISPKISDVEKSISDVIQLLELKNQLENSENRRKFLAENMVVLENENKKVNLILNKVMSIFYKDKVQIDLNELLDDFKQLKEDAKFARILKLAIEKYQVDVNDDEIIVYTDTGGVELFKWYEQLEKEGNNEHL